LKRRTAALLKRVGAFNRVLESGWRARRLLILCYHGISLADEHEWDSNLYMPAAAFRARMETIRRMRCTVLPLAEGIQRLYAGDLPERSVSITFDDGFHDFYRYALPILRGYSFPVTLYLTSCYCGFNEPWFPLIISYLLWKGGDDPHLAERVDRVARDGNFTAERKDDLARSLARIVGVNYDRLRAQRILHLMTPEEVKRVASAGVEIELHTHRHEVPLERELFCREIQENAGFIESLTGRRPRHFCYPNGVHRPEVLPWLRNFGVISGTTCQPGLASAEDDPLLLPRLVDHSGLTEVEFESWVSGVGAMFPRREGLGIA
jgi:peptidoglycan/xylan/chitin deacetylase (PgdA/CDA1 family)